MAKIHPQVYGLISKCYFYIGGYSFNYLVEIIDLFSMSKNFDIESKEKEVKEDFKKKHPLNDKQIDEYFSSQFSPNDRRNTYSEYVVNYLKSLEEVEIFKLLSDLLPHPKFKEMQWDSWNHKGEYVKSWRTDLIYYLNLCGVEYDFEKKEFKEINNGLNIQEAIFIPDLITIKFEDIFYKNLSNEINKCYKIGSHTSVFVLSRKLIENLLIDTLRKKYPINENNNIEIYY
ncbi:hypothetical protein HN935_03050, partial [archaeon]|nr:hypothetical protein [archaeon]